MASAKPMEAKIKVCNFCLGLFFGRVPPISRILSIIGICEILSNFGGRNSEPGGIGTGLHKLSIWLFLATLSKPLILKARAESR